MSSRESFSVPSWLVGSTMSRIKKDGRGDFLRWQLSHWHFWKKINFVVHDPLEMELKRNGRRIEEKKEQRILLQREIISERKRWIQSQHWQSKLTSYVFNSLIAIFASTSKESTIEENIKKSLSFVKQITGARIETLASIHDIIEIPRVLEAIGLVPFFRFWKSLRRNCTDYVGAIVWKASTNQKAEC